MGKGNKKNRKNPMARKMLCAAELFFFLKSCPFWHLLQLKFVLFLFVSVIITVIMRMSNSGQEGGGKQNKRTDYKFKMHIVAPVRKKQTYSPRNT